METIYVDKFRGFNDTVIPLEDVTFLVGENSSGKSSLLALINLMCSPDFWFSQNFNLPEYEFGGFRDILSATADKNDEFMFGASLYLQHINKNKQKHYTYLISYSEKDALPAVSFFARLDDRQILAFRNFSGTYRYRTRMIADIENVADARAMFDILRVESKIAATDYLDLPSGLPGRAGFFPLYAMLESLVNKDKSDEHGVIFPVPMFASGDIAWLAPIRTRPKRTYDGYGRQFNPEGEHTPYVLRKRLTGTESKKGFKEALISFGKASGLFSDVVVHELGEDASAPFELLISFCCKNAFFQIQV